MKKLKVIILLTGFILNISVHAQIHVSGVVRDAATNEVLIGTHVLEQGKANASISDNNGYFAIKVIPPASLEFRYVGYNKQIFQITASTDTIINIILSSDNALEEVVVWARKTGQSNVSGLSKIEMQSLPSISAKPDVLKSIQLLPGIQTQNEGSSLLLVRGGDPGQNLYLIDNIPLTYVNHLGGFMSVFNPEIINDIQVYKAGFPAHFGGKLSSIVDITQRVGNQDKMKGSLDLGLTDLSFCIEGPIKEKSSFIVTGRTSFLGLFMTLATKLSEFNNYTMYYGFHDLNAKYSYRPNLKNTLSFNLYQGDDYLNFRVKKSELQKGDKSVTHYIWGNWLASAQWNSIISSKLHASNSLSITRYRLKNTQQYSTTTEFGKSNYSKEFLSSIKDISLNTKWKYLLAKNYSLGFGLQSTYYINYPNKTSESNRVEIINPDPIKAWQNSLFLENKLILFEKLHVNIGLRTTCYTNNSFYSIKPEPRINMEFDLTNHQNINVSYMRVFQYSHLLFTPGNISNNEIWIPSDDILKPSMADQYTFGWQGDFSSGLFSSEINLFYKEMTGLVTYKEGYSSIVGDINWHSKIETGGIGLSRGLEFLVRKNYGDITGFFSYTYSNTTRKFNNINEGKEYIYEFDRPHSLSVGLGYKLSEKLKFNYAWVYQSGIPYTPAIGRQLTIASGYETFYNRDVYEALIYGERNSARMKPYHRLDISINYYKKTPRGNNAIWTFSLYNAYNRKNAYYYYYNTSNNEEMLPPDYFEDYKPLSLYQVSFLPIIPSISYKVYFNNNFDKVKSKNNFKKWLFYENN